MYFQISKTTEGWNWKLHSNNTNVLFQSPEFYPSKRHVMRAVNKLASQMLNLQEIPVIERLK